MTEAARHVGGAHERAVSLCRRGPRPLGARRILVRSRTPCIGGDDRVEYGRSGTIVKIVAKPGRISSEISAPRHAGQVGQR